MTRKRVFIVDNQEVVREMLTRYLELQPDLEVCGAASGGEEALSALPGRADVVLLDLGLNGMTGEEVLATIRERWPALACIILSGDTALEREAALMDAGAAAYVEKGDLEKLLAAIREAVS